MKYCVILCIRYGMLPQASMATLICTLTLHCHNTGGVWVALEWSLLAISILATISSITLIAIVSVPLCCGSKKTAGNQQVISSAIFVGQHAVTRPALSWPGIL